MRLNKKYIHGFGVLLLAGIVLISCEKTFDEKIIQQRDLSANSIAKVYIATVGASRNYVYVDSKPQNGSALSSGSVFPSTGYGFFVPDGQRDFLIRDTLTLTTQVPLSFTNVMRGGRNYTIFTYDTISAVKQKTVETAINIPIDTTCRVRFANFAYNGLAVTPAVDIVSLGKNEVVATNLQYTDVTEFIVHPTKIGTEAFQVRLAGTSTVLATSAISILEPKRSYTVVYRGSHRATSGASIRTVSLFLNY
ncbi:MAG: DUF4397 domain-containing protein [Bacteroidetes bacterium]|nr:DUF4397 domain-containing protein [Bacteroidota bacterium]